MLSILRWLGLLHNVVFHLQGRRVGAVKTLATVRGDLVRCKGMLDGECRYDPIMRGVRHIWRGVSDGTSVITLMRASATREVFGSTSLWDGQLDQRRARWLPCRLAS